MYGKYFVLFAILFTGWLLRRTKFIDDSMNHGINKLIVYFAYPCLIVHNIGSLEMSGRMIVNFLITFVISLACFYIYGLITFGYGRLRRFPRKIANVIEFSMITPNNGFMGFPIALIFFGENGLLLMLAHNAAMNFYMFTYGMMLLRRGNAEKQRASIHSASRAVFRLLVNPNILALFVGFILSLAGGIIPDAVDEYLLYIGNISTPMAMIFIGSSLEKYKFTDMIKNSIAIESSLMKLIWLPLITVGIVYFLPVDGLIKSIVAFGACFPTASMVSMLCEQENQDVGTASRILFLSTVASLVRIPVAVNLLKMLFM